MVPVSPVLIFFCYSLHIGGGGEGGRFHLINLIVPIYSPPPTPPVGFLAADSSLNQNQQQSNGKNQLWPHATS